MSRPFLRGYLGSGDFSSLFDCNQRRENTVTEVEGLTGWQRKYLRGLAHALRPVVLIGHGGLSTTLLDQVEQALTAHELIKVRFNDFKEERRTLTAQLEQDTHCTAVGLIGHTAILYRARPDPAKRLIRFETNRKNTERKEKKREDGKKKISDTKTREQKTGKEKKWVKTSLWHQETRRETLRRHSQPETQERSVHNKEIAGRSYEKTFQRQELRKTYTEQPPKQDSRADNTRRPTKGTRPGKKPGDWKERTKREGYTREKIKEERYVHKKQSEGEKEVARRHAPRSALVERRPLGSRDGTGRWSRVGTGPVAERTAPGARRGAARHQKTVVSGDRRISGTHGASGSRREVVRNSSTPKRNSRTTHDLHATSSPQRRVVGMTRHRRESPR
ncbi:MAG: YhbY family RNA-binding protein [Magnetococcales bacterium]|nr:YhbY family RNA-binding protein [Magnetococcales bacterium]